MTLNDNIASGLSSLVGIGCQSGDTVMGLSAVRRVPALAFLFMSSSLSSGTSQELSRRGKSGTRVFQVSNLAVLTTAAGRNDVSVVGIKPGSLADGIVARLRELNSTQVE